MIRVFGANFHSIRVVGRPPYRGGIRSFAVRGGPGRRKRSGTGIVTRDEPPGPMNTSDPWVAVKDPNGSGQIYYWNKNTDETTALGVPRPTELTNQPQPQRQGFLGMVAEGMAFGTGMHLAGRAVSSMLGGGNAGGGAGQGGAEESGEGDDDEWEV